MAMTLSHEDMLRAGKPDENLAARLAAAEQRLALLEALHKAELGATK